MKTISLQSDQEMVKMASLIRKDVALMTHHAKSSHIGSCFSIIEILVYLYGKHLSIRPESVESPDRDIFILSKGHAVAALYATLANFHFFSHELLETFGKDGSLLYGHPVRGLIPGIEASTGSLGHGLAIGIGFALGKKLNECSGNVYVLIGDGECNEGSIWEAALIASHHKLDNLKVIIDRNHLQGLGFTEDITQLDSLEEKWKAFGFNTMNADGHDFQSIKIGLNLPRTNQPSAIIFSTTKGKGVSFMENQLKWHYRSLSKDELTIALREIDEHANNIY